MQLKNHFSGTLQAAMKLAHKEPGKEARLVNACPAAPEVRYSLLLTPEVLESPKASAEPNGRARKLTSPPAPLNPLLKSLLSNRRAA